MEETHLCVTCVTVKAEVPVLVLTYTPRLNWSLIDRRISSQRGGRGGAAGYTGEQNDGLLPSAPLPHESFFLQFLSSPWSLFFEAVLRWMC